MKSGGDQRQIAVVLSLLASIWSFGVLVLNNTNTALVLSEHSK